MEKIKAKTILQTIPHRSFSWFGGDYNINLYKGCCHGCIYCDSRSECYQIDNFDTVRYKENAIEILTKELQSKKKKGVVAIGAMSDTYNPFEKEYEYTREAIKRIKFFQFGVAIDTKSDLVTRDIDLLKDMKNTIVKITITTADDHLSKQIEPHVCISSKRFAAIKQLSDAGIFTGVLLTPVLPFITDQEENIKTIVRLAYENGAKFVFCMFGMTLRQNQRVYYYQQLNKLFPGLTEVYRNRYKQDYSCPVPDSKKLYKLFELECKKYGLLYKMKDIIEAYKHQETVEQLSFDI